MDECVITRRMPVATSSDLGAVFQGGVVAAPVALGVLAGATIGARTLPHLSNQHLRLLYIPLLALLAVQMLLRGGALLLPR